MQDIAGNLGISKNAVSLALSGRPGVSAELRERVFAEAKRLGYHIHKKNQPSDSHFIGLIAREEVFSEHEFFGVINLHIEKEIKSRGAIFCFMLWIKIVKENCCCLPFYKTKR